jgi:hypothetical protein
MYQNIKKNKGLGVLEQTSSGQSIDLAFLRLTQVLSVE